MNQNILNEQQDIVIKVRTTLVPCEPQSMIGVDEGISKKIYPINGLRHPVNGGGSGWFIWSSVKEIPQDNPNFFKPTHAQHIYESYPLISKYLGLPPGWRFLIDDKGYEDIWYDASLFEV
ncbi:MAG: hypothetical protein JWO50_512 [Candidatus Kaiserbacteria bacterium]|nr:hypothetical protein [Candidatus Kaiserbacteria bacterium]